MRIEILCTGDEILTGKTVNTNHSHIAQRLSEAGLEVCWGTTVGDDRAALLTAFRLAAARADAVIVNGGLGPTVDDLSQEVAAEAAGVPLVLHEPYWIRTNTNPLITRPTTSTTCRQPSGSLRSSSPWTSAAPSSLPHW